MFHRANSLVLDTDSYKVSMARQYPLGTEYVTSYISSRGGKYDKAVFFGLQAFIRGALSQRITRGLIEFAKTFWESHGEPFPYEEWMYIVDVHGGVLPLKIDSLDEGTLVPSNVPMVVIKNTDPKCYWLTTWVETALLRAIWYPTTVASKSFYIRRTIKEYLEKSGDVSNLPFKLHDFGSRGASSNETAYLGGMAHLATGAAGTDTAIAILAAAEFYDADVFSTAWSIPAAEHSTITSWGRGGECLAYENMIKQFSKSGSIYAVVSDSYDIFNAVDNLWGKELKEKVISSGGTLVIRPDSGDPVIILPRLLDSLANNFGYTTNEKGYKLINNVRLIWGDGINELSIQSILRMVVDYCGYSADNLAFGMGGALLQIVNRDDLKFAMKACVATINGVDVPIFKDPITDKSKKSLSGNLDVILDESGNLVVVTEKSEKSVMKTRYGYNDGPYVATSFKEIQQRVLNQM